ncbi:Uncharacterised protein [Vibrio cholerae]|nr:Uncharacterised protein [Vibrio cholerae]
MIAQQIIHFGQYRHLLLVVILKHGWHQAYKFEPFPIFREHLVHRGQMLEEIDRRSPVQSLRRTRDQ